MNAIFKGSPNHNIGRAGHTVQKIVIHWFGQGTIESANTRFQNPATQVSAHYGISQGRLWQWVKEEDTAWHAGNLTVNRDSIGIEHDAGIQPPHDLSEGDYLLSAQLVAEISQKYSIPLDRAHIIGHREIKATQCPGTINIDKIIALAKTFMITKTKVSLYTKDLANPDIMQQGLVIMNQRIQAMVPDFQVITDVAVTTNHFDGRLLSDGKVDVYPSQILELDSKGAKVICLVHNGVQPQPTNPFHSAETLGGATPIQVPENWYVTFPEVFAQFYLHELCHAWYYLIDNLPYDQQIAKVHNPPENWGGYGNPIDYYISLIIELKPFWAKISDQAQGVEPMLTYKFTDNATEYILTDDATLIPMSASGLTKTLSGRPEKLIQLAPSERTKYKIVTSTVI